MLLTGSWFKSEVQPQRWTEAYYPPVANAFGISYAMLTLDAAARLCGERDPSAPFAYVVTPNAYHVVQHDRNPAFIDPLLNGAWFRLCDSRVVSLLLRLMGDSMPVVLGSELAPKLFETVIRPDDPITIIGMDTTVVQRLRDRFGLTNLHHYNPPMGFIRDEVAVRACIDFVVAHPSRFIFLVVGAMQQEELAFRIARDGRAKGLGLCLGGALEMMTGHKPRAPLWMQKAALEWLYRTFKEPRRIGRRVVNDCLPILGLAFRVWLKRRFG